MELHEKIKALRKARGMTQEELAARLYVSRTAVSKWESGRGYPSTESLKCLAKVFSASIDELLSSDELLALAHAEKRSNFLFLQSFLYGILDFLLLSFLFLPFYGMQVDGVVRAVNLLSYQSTTPAIRSLYFAVLLSLSVLGLSEMIFSGAPRGVRRGLMLASIVLHATSILLFALSRQPYVTAFLFLFFLVKAVIPLLGRLGGSHGKNTPA